MAEQNSGNLPLSTDPLGTLVSDTSGNVVNYEYNTLSRLSSAARQFAGLTGTYTHDRWGNRFQSGSDNSGIGYTPVVGSDINTAKNQFISTGPTPTSYDDAGQIISDNKFRGMQYQYDALKNGK